MHLSYLIDMEVMHASSILLISSSLFHLVLHTLHLLTSLKHKNLMELDNGISEATVLTLITHSTKAFYFKSRGRIWSKWTVHHIFNKIWRLLSRKERNVTTEFWLFTYNFHLLCSWRNVYEVIWTETKSMLWFISKSFTAVMNQRLMENKLNVC
jgi:hypothetical protein